MISLERCQQIVQEARAETFRRRRRAFRLYLAVVAVGLVTVLAAGAFGGFFWGGQHWNRTEAAQFRGWLNQHGTTAEVFKKRNPELAAMFEAPLQMTLRTRVVDALRRELGKPYVFGAAGPGSFDCSGLVRYVYAQFGIDLPHHAATQAGYGQARIAEQAKPGDLLFFGAPAHHEGVYIGDGLMIEAPYTGEVVRVSNAWRDDLTAIRSVLG